MLRSRSVKKLTPLLLFIAICAAIPFASFIAHSARYAQAAVANALPYHEFADGPYTVKGNQIIGADGKQYIFHGIGRDGLEFTCTGGGYLDAAHLDLMGPGQTGNGNTYWFANTVRINLAQNMWFNGIPGQCTAAQYQATVKSVVDTLTADHLNIMIDLMWTDADGQSPGGAQWQQGDAESVSFWQAVAPIYAGYSNVLFEALNEPHPASWACWLNGCPVVNDTSYVSYCTCTKSYSYTGVGMQALVNAIRGTGASNLILVAGMNWGYDLSQVVSGGKSVIAGSNIVFDAHPYPYGGKQPTDWDSSFGFLTSTFPVMSAESGEYDCQTSYMSQLIAYFDSHSMGYVVWSWWAQPGSNGCGARERWG
jgi:endoglucanase